MFSYESFLKELDKKLFTFFQKQKDFVCCKKGCSSCCEKGDYPLTEIELKYLMQGFLRLNNQEKVIVQENFKNIEKGGACPFLINKSCSVYEYRPIICRVHGLAYCYEKDKVKLPYCVNENKNFSKLFDNGEFIGEPIQENLDTKFLLKGIVCGEMRNLYDWINQ